jgi:tetratricopeptide (TPR) repeat protein
MWRKRVASGHIIQQMRLIALATCLLTVGCARWLFVPPLTTPAQGGRPWIEVRSEHFRVRTDVSARVASKTALELEQIWSAFEQLSDVAITGGERLTGIIDVVVFHRDADFFEVAEGPPSWGAFFREVPLGRERLPTVVSRGLVGEPARRLLQHELTHRLVSHFIPGAPLWLNEGLAQYLSTFELDRGVARFGKRPKMERFNANAPLQLNVWPTGLDRLPSLKALVHADLRAFRSLADAGQYYVASWALVHYLEHSPDLRPRFLAYQRSIAAGEPPDDAFARAFAGVDLQALDRDYRDEATTAFVAEIERPFSAVAVAAPSPPRVLDEAEVHLQFAILRPWTADPVQAARVRADLDQALERAPDSPEVAYVRGWFEALTGHYAAAEAEARRALARRPDEPRYRLALAHFIYDRVTTAPPPRDWEPLREPLKRIWAVAHSAEALNLIGCAYAQMGELDLALPFARRAVQADPSCWYCLDTLALLLAGTGFYEDAIPLQERAVALMPAHRPVPDVLERLEQYRAVLKARRDAGTVKPAVAR